MTSCIYFALSTSREREKKSLVKKQLFIASVMCHISRILKFHESSVKVYGETINACEYDERQA